MSDRDLSPPAAPRAQTAALPSTRLLLLALSLLGCAVLLLGVWRWRAGYGLPPTLGILAGALLIVLLVQVIRAPHRPGDVVATVMSWLVRWRARMADDLRAAIAVAGGLGAAFAFVLATGALRPGEEALLAGVILLLWGGLLLGAAIFFTPVALPITRLPYALPRHSPARAESHRLLRIVLIAAGTALLWLVAEANGHLLPGKPAAQLHHHLQVVLLCTGIGLIVAGLSLRAGAAAANREHTPRLELAALLAITLLGFGLRAWALGDSVRYFVDELNFGTVVYYFWGENSVPILQPLIRGFTGVYAYFQAGTVELWGRGLAGLRGASVIFGTLTIPALWFLARELFRQHQQTVHVTPESITARPSTPDRIIPLLAACLLALLPVHIHFSRLGMNNIADPLVVMLMLAFLARGLRTGRPLDWALGGVCLGLSQYFYEAGKLVTPPLAVVWLAALLIANRRRPPWAALGVMAAAALLTAAPIYYTLFGLGQSLTPRFDDVGRVPFLRQISGDPNQLRVYLEKLGWAFRVYVNANEYGVIYYGGQTAMLPLFWVPAFFIGLWGTLWHLRRPAAALPLVLLATSLGNSLLTEPRLYTRYNITFPVLALLMAAGLVFAARLILQPTLFTRRQYRLLRGGVYAGLAALVLLASAAQIAYYYGPHLARFNAQLRSYRLYDAQDALLRAAEYPRMMQVHLIAERSIDLNYARGIMGFLRDGIEVTVHDPVTTPRTELVRVLAALPRGIDHLFLIAPTDDDTLAILNQFFTLSGPAFSPYDVPAHQQLVLYVSRAAPADPALTAAALQSK